MHERFKRFDFLFSTLFLFSTAFFVPLQVWAKSNVPLELAHSPPAHLNYPDVLDLSARVTAPVKVVKLYFRKSGFDQFQLRIMKKGEQEGVYVYSLDTASLIVPEIAYYIEASTEGETFRFPAGAPSEVIELTARQKTDVAEVDLPAVSPPELPDPGLQSKWPLHIDLDSISSWELDAHEEKDSPFQREHRFLSDNNLRVSSWYQDDHFNASFTSNVYQTNHALGDQDDLTLTNVLLALNSGNHRLNIGDIGIQGSKYTLETYRRGLEYAFENQSLMFRLFDIHTQQNDDFDHLAPDSDANLYGGMMGFQTSDDLFSLKTVFVKGKDDPQESQNAEGISLQGRKGWTQSFIPRINLWDQKLSLSGEYAFGEYDGDLSDDDQEKGDQAWRGEVLYRHDWLGLGGNYYHIGKDFDSIGNFYSSQFSSDRKGYEIFAGFSFPKALFNLRLTSEESNVEDDSEEETSSIDSFSASLTLYPSDRFSLTAGYRSDDQETKDAGGSGSLVDEKETDEYSLRLDYLLNALSSVYLTGRFTQISSQTDELIENRTFSSSVGGVFRFGERLSVFPDLSYSETSFDNSDESSETFSAFLDAEFFLLPEKLSLSTLSSYNRTEFTTGNEGTEKTDREDIQLTGRINFYPSHPFGIFDKTVLSLKGGWAQTVENDQKTHSHSIALQLEFSL